MARCGLLIRNLSCPPTPAVYFAAGTSGQPCALVGPQPGDLNDQQEKSFQSSQAWGMGGGRGDRPARVPVPPRPDGVGRTGRGARERTWRGRVGRPSPGQLQSPSVSLAMGRLSRANHGSWPLATLASHPWPHGAPSLSSRSSGSRTQKSVHPSAGPTGLWRRAGCSQVELGAQKGLAATCGLALRLLFLLHPLLPRLPRAYH